MTKEQTLALQKRLNKEFNAGLVEDGIYGPKTKAAEAKYLKGEVQNPVLNKGDYFGAPYIGKGIQFLGDHETDAAMTAHYAPHWKKVGLPGYVKKGLSGNDRAWCSLKVDKDMTDAGLKGTGSAGAYSWSSWGRKCPFWFGAVLDIKHRSGGRHVAYFLYWIDEAKGLAAVMGGNQGNRFSIVSQTINKGGDVCLKGPRWSSQLPDGQFVSKAEVLKAYPHLKVGGTAGSTR